MDGRYTIVNVPAGPQRIRVQFIGHRPSDQYRDGAPRRHGSRRTS
jgi:hypothetical protein